MRWRASGSFDSASRNEAAGGCAQDDRFYADDRLNTYAAVRMRICKGCGGEEDKVWGGRGGGWGDEFGRKTEGDSLRFRRLA